MQINTNYGHVQKFIYFLDNCTIDNLRAGTVEWGKSTVIFHINICLTIVDEISGNL